MKNIMLFCYSMVKLEVIHITKYRCFQFIFPWLWNYKPWFIWIHHIYWKSKGIDRVLDSPGWKYNNSKWNLVCRKIFCKTILRFNQKKDWTMLCMQLFQILIWNTVLFPPFLQAIKPLLLFKACLEFYGIVYGTLIAVKMYSRPNSGGSFASFWLLVAVVYAIKW